MPLDETTATGAALEEEIPQEEVPAQEPVEEEIPAAEEVMSDEQKGVWDKLGLDAEEVDEPVKEPVEEETPPEDDKSKYSKGVQTRIDDITKHRREAERENVELKAKIAAFEAGNAQPPPAEVPEPPQETPQPDLKVVEIKESIKALKTQKRAARDDFDTGKEDEIDDKIDELKEQLFAEKYKAPAVDHANITKMVNEEQAKASFDHAAKDFSSKNEWFRQFTDDGKANASYDHVKSVRTIELNTELGATWQGTPYELFTEITNRINTEYPTAQPRKKASGVGGVNTMHNVTPSKTAAPVDHQTSKMLDGLFGDNQEAKNELLNSQKQGVA